MRTPTTTASGTLAVSGYRRVVRPLHAQPWRCLWISDYRRTGCLDLHPQQQRRTGPKLGQGATATDTITVATTDGTAAQINITIVLTSDLLVMRKLFPLGRATAPCALRCPHCPGHATRGIRWRRTSPLSIILPAPLTAEGRDGKRTRSRERRSCRLGATVNDPEGFTIGTVILVTCHRHSSMRRRETCHRVERRRKTTITE